MTDFVFFVFTAFVPVTGVSGSGTIRDALLLNLRHYGVPVTNMSAAVVCAEACRVASSAGKVDWRAFAPLAAVSFFFILVWAIRLTSCFVYHRVD